MPSYRLVHLNRQDYLDSTALLSDIKTQNFAHQALLWWDKHFNWKVHGCMVLVNGEDQHLSYIFYSIDRYKEYINIHNIFTPKEQRRQGHAYILLKMILALALEKKVKRLKLSSVSRSLDFYMALGFVYWGINSVGDYYCDLPIPLQGLDGMSQMIQDESLGFLLGNYTQRIYKNVDHDSQRLTKEQRSTIKTDTDKLGESYLFCSLEALK